HTLKVTTLSRLKPGAEVNMEADLVARYIEGFSRSAQAAQK
ncbi:MAG: riboflavin synthase, partial [Myxococcota bacterium]